MSEKKSIKRIAIIILIVANIAVIIALASSILKATTKIQIGKEIDTSTEEGEVPPDEETLSGEESTGDEQMPPENEPTMEEQTPLEDEPAIDQENPQEEEKEGTLTEVLGQLKNQKVSIVEIVLMFVGIGLFIMGAILLKIAKGMR